MKKAYMLFVKIFFFATSGSFIIVANEFGRTEMLFFVTLNVKSSLSLMECNWSLSSLIWSLWFCNSLSFFNTRSKKSKHLSFTEHDLNFILLLFAYSISMGWWSYFEAVLSISCIGRHSSFEDWWKNVDDTFDKISVVSSSSPN